MPINKNTFCVAPWYSIYLSSDQKMAPCCKFKTLQQSSTVEDYFTSPEIQKVRHDLLNGIKNKNCEKCWVDEKNGGDSLRLISNRTVAHSPDLKIADQISKPKLSNIISFDLTLGNLCNLKCIMCKPQLSSQLLAEANLNNSLKTLYDSDTKYTQANFDWPKQQEFVKWCEEFLPQAIHIKLTGGEPFIIPWIDQVIEHIPDKQKAKCILHFTSNLTVINEKLLQQFNKFKEVWISVSIEGIDNTFEYLRYGHKWKGVEKNIRRILDKKIPNLILKVNHVVQAPSFHSIVEMTKHFDSLKVKIHPILLTTPKYFTLASLTSKCKELFLVETEQYNGFNKEFMDYIRVAVKKNVNQIPENTKKMIEHLSQLDRVRGNNFLHVIPKENIDF